MFIYRVTRMKHALTLDGAGSRINGGRWNHIDTACIYTSASRALAVLEFAVNVLPDEIPQDLVIVTFDTPDNEHKVFSVEQLPHNWNNKDVSEITRNFGTPVLEKAEYLIIKIPSVVIPQEFNFLINPVHRDMKKVTIANVTKFSFDARLKK